MSVGIGAERVGVVWPSFSAAAFAVRQDEGRWTIVSAVGRLCLASKRAGIICSPCSLLLIFHTLLC